MYSSVSKQKKKFFFVFILKVKHVVLNILLDKETALCICLDENVCR